MKTATGQPEILIKRDFLHKSEKLFHFLKETVVWDERMKSRKTASFGVSYDYSGMEYAPVEMPENLVSICRAIEAELGFYPNNCLLNFYPDGNSSMGFHSDSSEELAAGTGVAIVSFGAERMITYRSKMDKSLEFSYQLESGTLLYMSNEVQEKWLHAIPKQEDTGERISLTFRQINNSRYAATDVWPKVSLERSR